MTGYIVTTFEKDGRLAEYTAELASVPDEQGKYDPKWLLQ